MRIRSVILSAGSPKKCSAPCCSSTSSERWIEPTDALVTLPYLVVRSPARSAKFCSSVLQVLEIDERQLLVVGDLEGDIEHALLRLAQIHQARQQQRPERGDRRADRMALVAEQVPEDHGIGLEVVA